MKKRTLILIAMLTMLVLVAVLACGCDANGKTVGGGFQPDGLHPGGSGNNSGDGSGSGSNSGSGGASDDNSGSGGSQGGSGGSSGGQGSAGEQGGTEDNQQGGNQGGSGNNGNSGNQGGNTGTGESGGNTGDNSGNQQGGTGEGGGSGSQGGETGSGEGGNQQGGETPQPQELLLYVSCTSGNVTSDTAMNKLSDGVYTLRIYLKNGDVVSIHDNKQVEYTNFPNDFDGNVTVKGDYTFSVKISGTSHVITMIAPQPSVPDPPKNTTVTVRYSNNKYWSDVYAYVWNYKTNTPMQKWPGVKLTSVGVSDYGEQQFTIQVDYAEYDRIIFNNGSGQQTKDLVVSAAVSGYYGEDGIFTVGTADYGRVEYFVNYPALKDTKNLNYLPGGQKKISVYTPAGYNKNKKYGVLYMFDSQNLYCAATGAEVPASYWAADVAVTNLVKNGNDGIIIVAIDNTDGHRDSELTMSQSFGTLTNLADNNDFYNGKLDELGNFMRETLIPWVNANYSVDTSREKTGIAGSSSGGLAAYYLGLRDNDLYGYIGAFSPANGLFTRQDWRRFYAGKDFSAGRPKIYAYCGENDDSWEDMLIGATKQITDLLSYGFAASDITENYVQHATHYGTYWRIAFMDFLGKFVA